MRNKKAGVYIVTNLVNGKNYIGYSNDMEERFDYHRQDLEAGRHPNRHLQGAWNTYGKDNFSFSILDECEEKEMSAIEHFWATTLKTHDGEFGYNILPTTICGILKIPREALIRGGLKRRGVKKPEGHGEKVSKALKGRKLSEEHKEKMREIWKGKGVGKENRFYGKRHSEESRRKMAIRRIKPIIQLDLEGNFIKEWTGGALEVEKELGFCPSTITERCREGNQKHYKNYLWKYKI